ncbi:tRNA (adenosine(37)-N6)-threonylcarbamoyltransferase complex dimerization subunit type 1 TsaB [Arsenicibacter rosenii]|uniref:tRNA (Adenosine(37)-N6)-threonylcarbamoyltransferase complex dimerization subunit type 1 TsaB n=1 Tax=Arsenicibacter rosenii TaxID=1750698 RepID=A0A1S2VBF1_9BACT|nr:tRNA (adenosine(37)-N6)-threonylcarbamoyltransferase complex dimerization subunit type 1 TsaB [Arsenicibacter rosenii]OIN56022.1 tRNA (adenosine(37)-N6)-threonylcarbamoyltransferase complex dimerization subunit type 1 TsaB [Arsenicibacter rosenii]
MLLLSIDTSTTICSVALHQNGTLLGNYELFTERTSSAMLTTLIDQVVQHTGFSLSQLDAVAVAKGPGSYTGLRIGVSTAKGLCFSLDKPLIAVNTLQGMAEHIRPFYATRATGKPVLICPMIDARRMEVYCALFDTAGHEVAPTAAKIIDEASFAAELAIHTLVFVGDGAAKCRSVLGNHPDALFPEIVISPSARLIGQLAADAWHQGRFEDVVTFEPFYLKDFMATTPRKLV